LSHKRDRNRETTGADFTSNAAERRCGLDVVFSGFSASEPKTVFGQLIIDQANHFLPRGANLEPMNGARTLDVATMPLVTMKKLKK